MGAMQQSGRCYSIGRAVSDDIAFTRASSVLQARDNDPKVGSLASLRSDMFMPERAKCAETPSPPLLYPSNGQSCDC